MNYDSAGARRKKYGIADQMRHERDEKIERDALRARVGKSRTSRLQAAEKSKRRRDAERGINSGTMGGSRASLMGAFFGR